MSDNTSSSSCSISITIKTFDWESRKFGFKPSPDSPVLVYSSKTPASIVTLIDSSRPGADPENFFINISELVHFIKNRK